MQEINYQELESRVLGIYINFPELLLEVQADQALFQDEYNRFIYQAMLDSIQDGKFDMAVYCSKLNKSLNEYSDRLQQQFSSKTQLPNFLKYLQKRLIANKFSQMSQQVMNGDMDPLEGANQLAIMSIRYNMSDLIATPVIEIEERQTDWLIPDFIEKNEITIFGGDGGSGKTSVLTSILSGLSSGHGCFFESTDVNRPKYKILYLSKEDGTAETLRKKFRLQDADMNNLYTFDLDDERLGDIMIGAPILESVVKVNNPDILVFDPLQSFIDPLLNMSARNQIRKIIDSLRRVCKKYNVTVILVMHSNKESKVWGRKRLADSSDLWDGARSVFLLGESDEDGSNYISHEKHNHCAGHETILFHLNDKGIPVLDGYSDKKDKDFVIGNLKSSPTSKLERAIQLILDQLEDQDLTFEDLMKKATVDDISEKTMIRARTQLQNENKIYKYTEYQGKGKGTQCLYSLDCPPSYKANQKN